MCARPTLGPASLRPSAPLLFLRALSLDGEGHVIHYAVSPGEGRATFESDAGAPGPRFRLEYELQEGGSVAIAFSSAPPGKPYQPYIGGTARRR